MRSGYPKIIRYARQRRQQAFSLLELMTVVVMIMVMVGIAVPNYLRLRMRAREAQAQHVLDMMCKAQRMFFRDNGQYAGIQGLEPALQKYVDFVDTDDYWDYSIVNAGPNGLNSTSQFVVRARSNVPGPAKELYIDQTGSVFRSYEAPIKNYL
ncbi:MAG: prepilin-type N-terminal cleavage/methylation domain-containing protein [Candidatus Omnitrophica bacterium]|nr:prepilin-type N-terminal cleavage/methylation domain-containing protein [Candidatus Omnitrophota bacterium]